MTGFPLIRGSWNIVHLISTVRGREQDPKDYVFSPLATAPGDVSLLAELESATNGRMIAQWTGADDLHPDDFVTQVKEYKYVNAAFAYTRPQGGRFVDRRRGAWRGALDTATALAEAVAHATRELRETGTYFARMDYLELACAVTGRLADLRSLPADAPCLSADPARAYPASQALARDVRLAGADGVIWSSVRHPGGTCLAIFSPRGLDPVAGALWRLEWNGGPEPAATRHILQ